MDNLGLYFLALIIPLIAQLYVSSSYKKYKNIDNSNKLTGFEVAKKILEKNGLNDMYIVETKGNLTDHYDPKRKIVRLSSDVFHGTSIASIAVAAHECGHAIQDKVGYSFMKIRSFIYPIVSFGTKFAYIVLMIGLIANMLNLIWLGILLVGLGLLFQLVTLPVEFDASKRALKELEGNIGVATSDLNGTKSMLNAAAMTYVAGVLSSALEILRLILIFTNNRD
ncbi:MAG: zinc metallopeptidase [Bacilli bacterium]|nr:zinc metallopeptidase [Bacilli bacterium]